MKRLGERVFYGVSAGVFIATFVVVLVIFTVVKPEAVLVDKDAEDDDKEVCYMRATLYATMIAIAVAIVYAVIASFFMKRKSMLSSVSHSIIAAVGAYIISKVVIMLIKPEALLKDDGEVDMVKENAISLSVALIVAVVDYISYNQYVKSKRYTEIVTPHSREEAIDQIENIKQDMDDMLREPEEALQQLKEYIDSEQTRTPASYSPDMDRMNMHKFSYPMRK